MDYCWETLPNIPIEYEIGHNSHKNAINVTIPYNQEAPINCL